MSYKPFTVFGRFTDTEEPFEQRMWADNEQLAMRLALDLAKIAGDPLEVYYAKEAPREVENSH